MPTPYESQGFAAPYPPSPTHKQQLLEVISSGRQQYNIPFDETVIAEAMSWYKHGDKGVLPPILDAANHSDGAASELIGEFLFENCLKQPDELFRALSLRPEAEQKQLGALAVSGDGSGHSPEETRRFKATLSRLSKQTSKPIAKSAQCWLNELASFKNQSQQ